MRREFDFSFQEESATGFMALGFRVSDVSGFRDSGFDVLLCRKVKLSLALQRDLAFS